MKMKGAILCGSKTYTSWMAEIFIKEKYSQITDWTYMDINEKYKPDIIGSMFDLISLYKMGIETYDVIILDICFIGGNIINEPIKEVQILAASLLARKGGYIVYVNMTRQYLTQLSIQNNKKYYEFLNKIYFNNEKEIVNQFINIINDIYNNLAKHLGINFLQFDKRSKDIENKKFIFDYVLFQK